MLKSKHEAEIKTIPEVASAVSFLETALQAPMEAEGEGSGDTVKKLEEKVKVRMRGKKGADWWID